MGMYASAAATPNSIGVQFRHTSTLSCNNSDVMPAASRPVRLPLLHVHGKPPQLPCMQRACLMIVCTRSARGCAHGAGVGAGAPTRKAHAGRLYTALNRRRCEGPGTCPASHTKPQPCHVPPDGAPAPCPSPDILLVHTTSIADARDSSATQKRQLAGLPKAHTASDPPPPPRRLERLGRLPLAVALACSRKVHKAPLARLEVDHLLLGVAHGREEGRAAVLQHAGRPAHEREALGPRGREQVLPEHGLRHAPRRVLPVGAVRLGYRVPRRG